MHGKYIECGDMACEIIYDTVLWNGESSPQKITCLEKTRVNISRLVFFISIGF